MKFRKRGLLFSCLLLALWLWDLGSFVAEIFQLAPEPPESIDLVAVLTGGKGRLEEALNSFKDGKSHYLLISGTGEDSSLTDILRVNKIENFPENLVSRIIVDARSRSTIDNVREILEIVEQKELRSVKVITSNYHLPRTMKLLSREVAGQYRKLNLIQIYPAPVESPNFSARSWWYSPVAWQILLSEYFKYRVIF